MADKFNILDIVVWLTNFGLFTQSERLLGAAWPNSMLVFYDYPQLNTLNLRITIQKRTQNLFT
jgi:hypothetical protein